MREEVTNEEVTNSAIDGDPSGIDLSELETAPYIAGTLLTAAPGDSISAIMGSSDPAAIAPAIPIGMAIGGALGGWGAGKALEKTSNEALGRRIQTALDVVHPAYDGGVGWPVFPRR